LLELLIALFMVAILTVSLSVTLKRVFDLKAASEVAVEPPRTAELAMELLRADIQNTLQPTTTSVLVGNYEATTGGATGNDADITFYTTADSPLHVDANGEVKEVEITTEPDPSNGSQNILVRRVVRNLLSETTVTPDEEVICRDVKSFSAQYFDGSNWNATWDSTALDNTIPVAVQLVFTISRSSAPGQEPHDINFTRFFTMPNSTAAQDPNVNSGVAVQ
jgi:type II secretory pathway component PulJ